MKSTPFADSWKELEMETAFYRNLLETHPMQSLQKKPGPAQWSMLEVIEHLVGAEEGILQYLKKKEYAPLESRGYMPGGLRAFLLRLALRSPLKFKAPKVLENLTLNTTDPNALLERWKSVRTALQAYVEHVPAAVSSKPLFRHPRAGALTIAQTLDFMADHLRHHRRQVLALLEQKKRVL